MQLGAANQQSDGLRHPATLFLDQRAYFSDAREVALSSRVAAFTAHMYEIGERLGAGSTLMKVRPFSTKGICRNHRLGLKAVTTYWTA